MDIQYANKYMTKVLKEEDYICEIREFVCVKNENGETDCDLCVKRFIEEFKEAIKKGEI